jgi:phospho-N-acetylmuramoyl-pentapeptide-transferase
VLDWLGQYSDQWGPLRLLSSRLFLSALGVLLAALATWALLTSRALSLLPRDRGRAHAVGSDAAVGKPTGAGILFIGAYLLVCLLVVPVRGAQLGVYGAVLAAAAAGYLDDRAEVPWGEYRKALLDAAIAFAAAAFVLGPEPLDVWLPFWAPKVIDPETGAELLGTCLVPAAITWPVGTAVLWIAINATNCTDGVDGLSGGLLSIAFVCLGGILYAVVGQKAFAAHLLVPFYRDAPHWATMSFALLGVLAAYLWHNAFPSALLMGDAGSRPLGLLLGVFVLASGNVFLLPVVAGILLVNGGTGLVKVGLLRFFRIGILRGIRFPLHDHVRKNLGWSAPQVLVRFMILQGLLAPFFIVVFLKVR